MSVQIVASDELAEAQHSFSQSTFVLLYQSNDVFFALLATHFILQMVRMRWLVHLTKGLHENIHATGDKLVVCCLRACRVAGAGVCLRRDAVEFEPGSTHELVQPDARKPARSGRRRTPQGTSGMQGDVEVAHAGACGEAGVFGHAIIRPGPLRRKIRNPTMAKLAMLNATPEANAGA